MNKTKVQIRQTVDVRTRTGWKNALGTAEVRLVLDGYDCEYRSVRFGVVNQKDGFGWSVIEPTTGLHLTRGGHATRTEAIKEVQQIIDQFTKKYIDEVIDKQVNREGWTELHDLPIINK